MLGATVKSFDLIKRRLQRSGSDPAGDAPLLEAGVQLSIPAVAIFPSLTDVQQAVNSVANQARLQMPEWTPSHHK